MGLATLAFGLGVQLGRLALLPGRVLARSGFVEPVVRGRAEALASAGRDAEIRGRQRLEEVAGMVISAPETARTFDRALAGPVSEGLGDEAIARLTRRLLESPALERALRDAAQSPMAHSLIEDALHSPELQRAIEEVLSGPGVRNALRRETRTFWNEVATQARASAAGLDDAAEQRTRRLLGRHTPTVEAEPLGPRYGGLASRGAGLLVDAAITGLLALAVGSLAGLAGSLLGISAPTWLVAALAGAGWTLFVSGYFVFFWATAGQTPGQRILHLRVTDRNGGPVSVRRALVRIVGLALAIAPLGAGFLPVLFDRRRRALQDFLARTVVVAGDGDPP